LTFSALALIPERQSTECHSMALNPLNSSLEQLALRGLSCDASTTAAGFCAALTTQPDVVQLTKTARRQHEIQSV